MRLLNGEEWQEFCEFYLGSYAKYFIVSGYGRYARFRCLNGMTGIHDLQITVDTKPAMIKLLGPFGTRRGPGQPREVLASISLTDPEGHNKLQHQIESYVNAAYRIAQQ